MKIKITFAIIISLSFLLQINAQNTVVAPSPTSSALGEYANTPVNLFRGQAQITVPLIGKIVNDIPVTVSLSYNPSGNKVETIASWVGLGWSLQAGGVITRSVLGLPDDLYKSGSSLKSYLDGDLAQQLADFDLAASEHDQATELWDLKEDGSDLKPDIFFFNFAGHSGKFVFGADKEIKQIPFESLKISYDLDGNGQIIRFNITTNDGTRYTFDECEETTIEIVGGDPGSPIPSINRTAFKSSWYLSKIKSPKDNEINFTYADETIQYDTRIPQMWVNSEELYSTYVTKYIFTEVKAKRLSQISFNSGYIDFEAGNDREDLIGSKSLKV
ncbi:MAG: hypothetical protein HC831_29085 [Chloroflexia bacterium]|nr:hypothetical protein [Chloroflexia bacterium]